MPWLAFFLLFASSMTPATSGVMGDWMGPTQSIIRVYPCGGSFCAKIVKLAKDAPSDVDKKNPDPALRSRRLCGLNIGTGFHKEDGSHLLDGHLYDPESGNTYSGTMTANGDQLKLHGYIGISLLGRTEIWHRAPTTDEKACAGS